VNAKLGVSGIWGKMKKKKKETFGQGTVKGERVAAPSWAGNAGVLDRLVGYWIETSMVKTKKKKEERGGIRKSSDPRGEKRKATGNRGGFAHLPVKNRPGRGA